MKRSWKTLLATCAIAVTALIAPGIQSKAATSVNREYIRRMQTAIQ